MGLPRPFYRLLLDDDGLSVWMAGEQDKPEASRKYAWHDMHLAYRTPNAIYLYVQQNQAYLLNDSLDAAWSLLQASLPAERLQRIEAPVLLLAGTHDLIKTSHTRWMASEIPHSRLCLIAGGTHQALFRQKEQCLREIHTFLEKFEAAPHSPTPWNQ